VWGRPDGLGDDGFEVTDTGHGRFVDDQKGAVVEQVEPTGPRSDESVDRRQGDVGAGLELVGSAGRGCGAHGAKLPDECLACAPSVILQQTFS
jgi:hypothetical protein